MKIRLKQNARRPGGSCEVHSIQQGLEKAGADNTAAHNLLAQFGMGTVSWQPNNHTPTCLGFHQSRKKEKQPGKKIAMIRRLLTFTNNI